MKISGIWEGYYEYGYGYVLPYFGERVKITLQMDGNQGNFKGRIVEEKSNFSVPYESIVEGFIENNIVSFNKIYPVIPNIQDDNITIEYFDGNLEIDHSGYFDEDNSAMYGTWIIHNLDEEAEAQGHFCAGTWLLKRIGD